MQYKSLIAVVFAAMILRLTGVNWDSGAHLHPDERFLTMVTSAMQIPQTFGAYLSSQVSSMNPVNIEFPFFVYGLLPLTMVKLVAISLGMDSYDGIVIVGRVVSALLDVGTVIAIYVIAQVLSKRMHWSRKIPRLCALIYALSPLSIQLSHFFATDTFLNFFLTASTATMLSALSAKKLRIHLLALSGVLFGFALASKVTAIFLIPCFCYFALDYSWRFYGPIKSEWKMVGAYTISILVMFGIIAYVSVRIGNPYMFESANPLDPRPSVVFMENLKILKSYDDPNGYFPPAIQWMSRDVEWVSATQPSGARFLHTLMISLYTGLTQGVVVAIGIVPSVLAIIGLIYAIRKRQAVVVVMGIFVVAFALYQSLQFVKSPRYYLIIHSYIAILAGVGFGQILHVLTRYKASTALLIQALLVGTMVFGAIMFMSIYTRAHSRIAASDWMYQHIPTDSILLWEYWDDPLPLARPPRQSGGRTYRGEDFHSFAVDDREKWEKMGEQLVRADYYVLSSNRGWGSIMAAPEKYPIMSRLYTDLLNPKRRHTLLCGLPENYSHLPALNADAQTVANEVCALGIDYRLTQTFASYPSLEYLGIPVVLPDQWTDESRTVYDHPLVMIFKNQKK